MNHLKFGLLLICAAFVASCGKLKAESQSLSHSNGGWDSTRPYTISTIQVDRAGFPKQGAVDTILVDGQPTIQMYVGMGVVVVTAACDKDFDFKDTGSYTYKWGPTWEEVTWRASSTNQNGIKVIQTFRAELVIDPASHDPTAVSCREL